VVNARRAAVGVEEAREEITMPKIFPRKKGGNLYIRLYANGGERLVCLGTNKKRVAERKAAEMQYGGKPKQSSVASIAILDVWPRYMQTSHFKALTPASSSSKFAIWRIFAEWLPSHIKSMADIDALVCQNFLDHIGSTHKTLTVSHYKTNLSNIFKLLATKAGLTVNPWSLAIPPPKTDLTRYRAFSNEEVTAILSHVDAMADKFFSRYIRVALYTGMRAKDAIRFHSSWIKNGIIEMVPAKTHRSGKKIRVPIHPELSFLSNLQGYLFPSQHATYNKDRAVYSHLFTKMLKKLEIKSNNTGKVCFHSLRATFITAADDTMNRSTLQGIVGHGSPLMTDRYSEHRAEIEQIAAINFKTVSDRNNDRSLNIS